MGRTTQIVLRARSAASGVSNSLRLLQQPVLHREHRGAGAGRDADSEIDVLNVVLDGTSGEYQPFRDVGVGQPSGYQPKYLQLPFGEVGWASAPNAATQTGSLDHRSGRVG